MVGPVEVMGGGLDLERAVGACELAGRVVLDCGEGKEGEGGKATV